MATHWPNADEYLAARFGWPADDSDLTAHHGAQDSILTAPAPDAAITGVGWLYWAVVALGMLTACVLLLVAGGAG